ncbi:hypothetical protein ILUMI_11729 [Ignelater luminosus]|uniref:Uncharacterized protein n=1 Tax=Ignelater luminosus TaxID=2038154 RepID=A0A8K0CVJ1_IGNLU|nr:hypothetical protein ILUMI_11729 [Ignelater luminosus]
MPAAHTRISITLENIQAVRELIEDALVQQGSDVNDSNINLVAICGVAKQLWDKLIFVYEQSSGQCIHKLMEYFFSSEKNPPEDITTIVVFRNKAYLTLPRSSCYNNLTDPTLIEAYWNGDKDSLVAGRKIAFPSENHQNWGKCDQLQDAVSVDVELKKGRLWVLDRGSKKCSPKIVIYNLYTNSEICKHELDKNLNENVSCLVVDSSEERNINAYIGHDENVLTIFSFKDANYWSLRTEYQNKSESFISTRHLALSKVSPVLYIGVDDSSELFYVNLTDIKKTKKILSPGSTSMRLPEIKIKLAGYKLGPSAGIIADTSGGLSYFLIRDFAVVRWDTSVALLQAITSMNIVAGSRTTGIFPSNSDIFLPEDFLPSYSTDRPLDIAHKPLEQSTASNIQPADQETLSKSAYQVSSLPACCLSNDKSPEDLKLFLKAGLQKESSCGRKKETRAF